MSAWPSEASHLVGDGHHLFLIDDDPIGVLQDRFEFGHLVGDWDLALLAFDEVRNQIHWARAIERDDGDDIFEAVRFQAGQEVAHPGAFQLKEADRLSGGEEGKSLGVVERHLLHDQRWIAGMPLIDQILGPFDHRESFEAQEIEFDEPDLFDVSHRILSDDFVIGAFIERHMIRERPFRNHHAGGVGRGMPRQSFKGAGNAHQLFHSGIGLDEIAQFSVLDRAPAGA